MTALNRLCLPLFDLSLLNANTGFSSTVIDASTEKRAAIFSMADDATITHAGFRYALRTGTPPTYRISLQGVGTDGNPDGTVLGGGSPASATFTPPADASWDGTVQWIALANSIAVTRGQFLAHVIDYSSGTIDGSNNSAFTRGVSAGPALSARAGLPYTTEDTTGAWVKLGTAYPLWGIKSSTRVYGLLFLIQSDNTVSSSGNRAAMRFKLPTGIANTVKIAGLRLVIQGPATANNIVFGIWNAAGTAQQSVTVDGDFIASVANNIRMVEVYFATPATLSTGTVYYAGIERAASNVLLDCLTYGANNDMGGLFMGEEMYLGTWNGATWTDTNTTRPFVELILADAAAPPGGSTRSIHIGGPVNFA